MRYGKRLRRFYHKGAVYFIITFPENRVPFFHIDELALFLKLHLILATKNRHCYLWGLAILPEHLHLMIETFGSYNISQIMHYIKRHSSRNINKVLSHPTGEDRYPRFLFCSVYQKFNPPSGSDDTYRRWYIE